MRSISTIASGSAPRWSCCADRHRALPCAGTAGGEHGRRGGGDIAPPSLTAAWADRGRALGGEFVKIVAPHAVLPAAELEEIVPAEDAGGMQVVERQAHGVIADRVDLQDRHIALAGNGLALVRRVALNSALGL